MEVRKNYCLLYLKFEFAMAYPHVPITSTSVPLLLNRVIWDGVFKTSPRRPGHSKHILVVNVLKLIGLDLPFNEPSPTPFQALKQRSNFIGGSKNFHCILVVISQSLQQTGRLDNS